MGRGWPTKKVHEYPVTTSVLIHERTDYTVVFQDRLHPVKLALLGKQLLASALSKAPQKLVQIWIVQRPRHCIRLEAKQSQCVACHLPVPKVPRYKKYRPTRQQNIDYYMAIWQVDELLPIVQVQLARQVDDLCQH